ncbi:DMT family transporter [Ketogulonicigenium vulgare]|uniref:Guanidinium exporter n=1 Tax=Ketogulonicigenium vulgare (strain WSH-001) TaxID=759362 RepID=F9Y445_KETVW|nr:multidrug efflux SMR transporter [Ketogulonicigenium vulgare]ADO42284.1 quarternary ammonium compound transport protein; small multidrug resistance family [Ketogulonicigenium vulgare Y25]AEM40481.1 Chaperone-like protein transmembrane protein [Ketogulonicigenium vulgare WSH-001]ALJ80666.1 multidrug transporter [Ketogulonicigenium vulgare]ANW33476.1 multidrug transporter [Ketogulonicigenium vulgare]AOZ54197.1 quarternary ammonium compound transport protein; small multidrug resistance family 
MAWVYLVLAGAFEIVWAYTMKLSDGFTKPLYTSITIVTMVFSFALLSMAMKVLPLGTAYMIWTGIGAIGAFTIGVLFLGEALTPMRVIAALLLLSGLILMKLATK